MPSFIYPHGSPASKVIFHLCCLENVTLSNLSSGVLRMKLSSSGTWSLLSTLRTSVTSCGYDLNTLACPTWGYFGAEIVILSSLDLLYEAHSRYSIIVCQMKWGCKCHLRGCMRKWGSGKEDIEISSGAFWRWQVFQSCLRLFRCYLWNWVNRQQIKKGSISQRAHGNRIFQKQATFPYQYSCSCQFWPLPLGPAHTFAVTPSGGLVFKRRNSGTESSRFGSKYPHFLTSWLFN